MMFNYSFWADEAGISSIAKQWMLEKISLISAFSTPGIFYQKLHMFTVGVFLKLFGASEFTARLPSIIIFFVGIIIIFLLAKKLSNVYGGLVSAFLYTFSHLNLSYATQAKPYMGIEVLTLAGLFYIYSLEKERLINFKILYHFIIIILFSIATFFHEIGVFLWVIYGAYIFLKLLKFKSAYLKILNRSKFFYILIFLASIILFLPIKELVMLVFRMSIKGNVFVYSHLYQIIKLFGYKYFFITLSSIFGYIWLYKKHREIGLAIFFYLFLLFIFASFVSYVFNIRYVLSVFGIMFLFFGVFLAKVGEKYFPKKPWLIPILIIAILYISGYKIVRLPQAYYNPNIDKYGDIQIANYKDFYAKLKKTFPDYKKLYVINDTFDVEYWYFGRYSNVYFMKSTIKPYKHHTANAMIYESLADFKKFIKEQPQGLLIMEDWESFLPEDVKQYAKKNLKLEFRVESLKEAPDDPWPIALYSWGMK